MTVRKSENRTATEPELQKLINKRMILNLLIQGAGRYYGGMSNFLVRDELDELHPSLGVLYDQMAVLLDLSDWCFTASLIIGNQKRFWRSLSESANPEAPRHIFSDHPFLVTHGEDLALCSKARAYRNAKIYGMIPRHPFIDARMCWITVRMGWMEGGLEKELEDLGKKVTSSIWSIDEEMLDARLSMDVEFGELRKSENFAQTMLRSCAVSYSGVLRTEDRIDREYQLGDPELFVKVLAKCWMLLTDELSKGTAELICMHGMNTVDRESWLQVRQFTDRLDFETWTITSGAELWRRFLDVRPPEVHQSKMLMKIAMLEPDDLESLMDAVARRSHAATEFMLEL